jgi:putative membrane protein
VVRAGRRAAGVSERPGAPAPDGAADPDGAVGADRLRRSLPLWFAPRRIREEGETPDYRFSLANERTFLAWIRTALALVGGGFAVDQFLPHLDGRVRAALAIALLAVGALASLRAVNHWVRCERAMRRGEDLPVTRFPTVLSLVVGLLAVGMLVVVLLGRGG